MNSDIKQFLALRESLLQERAAIESQIQKITSVLGQPGAAVGSPAPSALSVSAPAAAATPAPKKRKLSAASRAKLRAAAIARWAKRKGTAVTEVKAKKPTRKISAAGRASIAAAQRARWAKLKAQK